MRRRSTVAVVVASRWWSSESRSSPSTTFSLSKAGARSLSARAALSMACDSIRMRSHACMAKKNSTSKQVFTVASIVQYYPYMQGEKRARHPHSRALLEQSLHCSISILTRPTKWCRPTISPSDPSLRRYPMHLTSVPDSWRRALCDHISTSSERTAMGAEKRAVIACTGNYARGLDTCRRRCNGQRHCQRTPTERRKRWTS